MLLKVIYNQKLILYKILIINVYFDLNILIILKELNKMSLN